MNKITPYPTDSSSVAFSPGEWCGGMHPTHVYYVVHRRVFSFPELQAGGRVEAGGGGTACENGELQV